MGDGLVQLSLLEVPLRWKKGDTILFAVGKASRCIEIRGSYEVLEDITKERGDRLYEVARGLTEAYADIRPAYIGLLESNQLIRSLELKFLELP